MKSDIRGHFPEHIGRILEFQEIGTAGDIEIDRIWEVLAQELRNCFLDSLDERVKRWKQESGACADIMPVGCRIQKRNWKKYSPRFAEKTDMNSQF